MNGNSYTYRLLSSADSIEKPWEYEEGTPIECNKNAVHWSGHHVAS